MQLPKRQQDTLDFIRRFITQNSYAPSTQEIADAMSFTTTAAAQKLTALERAGAIKRTPRTPRSIVVLA